MTQNLDLFKIILESGPVVKLVLLILILLSIFSWGIILFKRKALKKIEKENDKFLESFSQYEELSQINLESQKYQDSTFATIFNNGYEEIQKLSTKLEMNTGSSLKSYLKDQGTVALDRSLKKGLNESNEKMDLYLSPLASISSVAPFIGLFGTVWGIINSFRGLSAGGGTIEAVAPGIAEALVATAVGLFAAIPANWFFNIFNNKINKINLQMESFQQDFLNLVDRIVLTSKE